MSIVYFLQKNCMITGWFNTRYVRKPLDISHETQKHASKTSNIHVSQPHHKKSTNLGHGRHRVRVNGILVGRSAGARSLQEIDNSPILPLLALPYPNEKSIISHSILLLPYSTMHSPLQPFRTLASPTVPFLALQ